MSCAGSWLFTLNGDRIGAAPCKVCGKQQLLHVKLQFNTGRTAGTIPAHEESKR